jgi:membrane associated rhomboid family serine protease
MFGQSDSDDYQPFGYLGRIPLYLTTILLIVYCVAMAGLVIFQAVNPYPLGDQLIFDTDAVRGHFEFWRFLTYPLVNGPSIWFVLDMVFLYWFGRDVERFFGRTAFGMLYLSLVLIGPCLLTAVSLAFNGFLIDAGSQTINFGVFIGFCTVYPDTEFFGGVRAKWIAAILGGIDLLIMLSVHAWDRIIVFVATCLCAFVFVKYLRGHLHFSLGNYFREHRSRRNLRPLPKPNSPLAEKPNTPRDNVIESIDPLLDKIAKHGIASLTDRERERLEQARTELLKKPAQ